MKLRLIAKATLWIPILRHSGTGQFCFAAPKSGAVFLMLFGGRISRKSDDPSKQLGTTGFQLSANRKFS